MSSELPGGWRRQLLSCMCSEVLERIDPTSLSANLTTPYIGLEHIGQGTGRLEGRGCATEVVSQKSRFQSGDILFGKLRPKLCKVTRPTFNGVCSTDIIVLRAAPDANPDFLAQLLQSKPLISHAVATAAGTKMPRTHARSILSFEVTVPTVEEQQRIADVLRSMDEVVEASKGVIAQLRSTQSAESGAFFSQVSDQYLPKHLADAGWRHVRLGQVFSERSEPGSEGIPVASVSIVRGLVLRATLERRVQSDLPPEGHSLVRTNDIAYNMMRMWQGACGIALHDCMVSPAYVVVTPSHGLNPRFAYHMLRSKSVIRLLHGYSQGVVDDRLRLYPRDFFQIPINLPPLARQLEIAASLDAYELAQLGAEKECEAKVNVRAKLASDLISGRVRVPAPVVSRGKTVPPAFKRAVFAAEIVHQLHNDNKFGSVKHEKIVYLCEAHLGLNKELDRHVYKEAAGPYDPKARRSVEGIFAQQKWFKASKVDGRRVVYEPLENAGSHTQYFDRYFGEHKPAIQSIIDLLRPLDTQQCEIVATLYAVWNDFLIDGQQPTEKEIIEAVFRWHPKKREIAEWHWQKALPWMQKKGLIPAGTGERTRVAKK